MHESLNMVHGKHAMEREIQLTCDDNANNVYVEDSSQ